MTAGTQQKLTPSAFTKRTSIKQQRQEQGAMCDRIDRAQKEME